MSWLFAELYLSTTPIELSMEQTFEYPSVRTATDIAKGMEVIMLRSEQMSKAARTRAVQRFSLEHWYARHEAVFKSLIGELQ